MNGEKLLKRFAEDVKRFNEAQIDELETYKGRWMVLYIHNNGSFTGNGIYISEGEAEKARIAAEILMQEKAKQDRLNDCWVLVSEKRICLFSDLKTSFPIPVGDA